MPSATYRAPGVTIILVVALTFIVAASAFAQSPEPIPRFAIDLQAATAGLPQAEGWVPAVSAGTLLPGRNWGVVAGATVYPVRLGLVTFGIGASLMSAGGTKEPVIVTTGTGATATTSIPTTPVVHTAITHLAAQLSINFGRKLGWSYLSAGFGRSKVSSNAEAVGTTKVAIALPDSWNPALNFGGGAKWFMKPHLGAGFDVRFVKLSSRSPTDVLSSAKRTQLWNISAGISIQ